MSFLSLFLFYPQISSRFTLRLWYPYPVGQGTEHLIRKLSFYVQQTSICSILLFYIAKNNVLPAVKRNQTLTLNPYTDVLIPITHYRSGTAFFNWTKDSGPLKSNRALIPFVYCIPGLCVISGDRCPRAVYAIQLLIRVVEFVRVKVWINRLEPSAVG